MFLSIGVLGGELDRLSAIVRYEGKWFNEGR